MKPLLSTFLLFLTAASLWSATPPPANKKGWTSIKLDRDPGASAIGVEPLGGVFTKVIEPNASSEGHYIFSIENKKQARSVLAIYATNHSVIPFEKPLARVRLEGLEQGETRRRIDVHMIHTTGQTLLISAEDLWNHHQPMTITKMTEQVLLQARLEPPAGARAKSGLSEIAAGPLSEANKQSPNAAFKEFIGVRGTGGIFQPVLAARRDGTLEKTDKALGTTYIRTAFPGARTADVTLFAGNSPFIEKTRTCARYIISGMTNPQRKNVIKLELTVDAHGKMNNPTATEEATKATPGADKYSHPLTVVKYSTAALEKLQASGQLGQTPPAGEILRHAGHIPADPTR